MIRAARGPVPKTTCVACVWRSQAVHDTAAWRSCSRSVVSGGAARVVDAVMAANPEETRHRPPAESRHSQELLARCAVDVDRERLGMAHGPHQLGIGAKIEIRRRRRREFVGIETAKAEQPVGLVEAMFTHQRRRRRREIAVGTLERRERRVVDATQSIVGVQLRRLRQDLAVAVTAGAHDHLRALAGGHEPRCRHARGAVGVPRVGAVADLPHRGFDHRVTFLRRQLDQLGFHRELDVRAQAIGPASCLGREEAPGMTLRWM